MSQTSYFNIYKNGQQLQADTPVAVIVRPDDAEPHVREYTGKVREDGRLWVTHDIPFGDGASVTVLAAPGCATWGPHRGIVGSEWTADDPVFNSIDLVEGSNPFA